MDMQVKVWRKEDVLALLDTSDKAVANAVKGLYARQTEVEQTDKTTRIANGRGFNAKDAPFLSDIAVKPPRYSDRMTPKQLAGGAQDAAEILAAAPSDHSGEGRVVEFPTSLKREIAHSAMNPVEEADEVEASETQPAMQPMELPSIGGSASARWGMF